MARRRDCQGTQEDALKYIWGGCCVVLVLDLTISLIDFYAHRLGFTSMRMFDTPLGYHIVLLTAFMVSFERVTRRER